MLKTDLATYEDVIGNFRVVQAEASIIIVCMVSFGPQIMDASTTLGTPEFRIQLQPPHSNTSKRMLISPPSRTRPAPFLYIDHLRVVVPRS
jgi:hypothetical protein